MEEKISVIVPIYNVENYIKRCVESILKQTYKNIELILVDDGSTDNSGTICDEFSKKDKRIQVVHKNNGGVSEARNAGLEKVSGEYIMFVDSDDWIDPFMMEKMYRTLKKYDTELVVCEPIYAYETHTNTPELSGESFLLDSKEALKLLVEDRRFRSVLWNKLYARRLWQDIRFPKGKHYEDVRTIYKIYDLCEKIAFLEQGLYYYFQRDESIVHSSQIDSYLELVDAVEERKKGLEIKYPDMSPQLAASVVSAVLIVYREAGIHQIKMKKDTENFLNRKVKAYKQKGMFQYFSPRFKLEYMLYSLTPKGLTKVSKYTEKIINYLRRVHKGRKML